MAIAFAGTGQWFAISDLPSPQVPVTAMLWGMLHTDRNQYSSFLSYDAGADWYIGTASDGTSIETVDQTGSDVLGSTLALNRWYHIALTADSITNQPRRLYLNGKLDVICNGVVPSGGELRIGDLNASATYGLAGRMAAIKVWSGVLSIAEIHREMRCYKPVRLKDLWAFWPFIQQDTAAADQSGNGRNLTQNGGVTNAEGPPIPWLSPPFGDLQVAAGSYY